MTRVRNVGLATLAAAAMVGAMVASSLALAAADATKEIQTAWTHAGFAAKGSSLDVVRLHLHHALNCLVGPGGKGYDAAPGDPCKGMGNGAIADSAGNSRKDKLEEAAAAAREGIADKIYSLSQAQAVRVQKLLKEAEAMK